MLLLKMAIFLQSFCFYVKIIDNECILLQEGKVRVKLAKILAGYDDVLYERSSPTAETIKVVSIRLWNSLCISSLLGTY